MGLVRTILPAMRGCDDVQREGREMGELGRQLWGGVVVHREGPPAELRAVATGVEIPAAIPRVIASTGTAPHAREGPDEGLAQATWASDSMVA